ncbi:MAG: hypothetical protein RIB32_02870 [Phycisphaerales bacterium]
MRIADSTIPTGHGPRGRVIDARRAHPTVRETQDAAERRVGCLHNERPCENGPIPFWAHLEQNNRRDPMATPAAGNGNVSEGADVSASTPAGDRPAYAGPRLGDVPRSEADRVTKDLRIAYRRTVMLPTGSTIDVLA